jgi:hypothetical protein
MHVLVATNSYQVFLQERLLGVADHRIPRSPDHPIFPGSALISNKVLTQTTFQTPHG